jgi:hypothetical protein
MLKSLKRIAIAGMTAVTLAGVSVLAAATTPTGTGLLRHLASGVASVLNAQRPIDASAGGVATFSPGVTMSLAPTATVTDKLLVAGTVTFQCPLMLDFNGRPASTTGTVIVQQASGKTVVNGQGTFNVTCDGQTHINPYAVTPYNAPYKRGGAIAEAFFGQYGGFCVYGIFGFQCASGDTGSVPISIGH